MAFTFSEMPGIISMFFEQTTTKKILSVFEKKNYERKNL